MIRTASVAWLLVLVAVTAACSPTVDEPAVEPPPTDPAVTAEVIAAFATYRAGVEQGDADAVLAVLDDASVADMARIAALARDGDEATVRALPAADQLLVLTYRLRSELLDSPDPYAALVEARLAGQDRSLGDIGPVTLTADDTALGVVVDPATRTATPLRWRFRQQDQRWHFDLVDAHRLVSQAIANTATRADVGVDELVAATVVDLSGEEAATVEALYTELPG